MDKYEPRLMEGDGFPVCDCGCATYSYSAGPIFSLRFLEESILTDIGGFSGVTVGHWRCAGCGMTALILVARDSGGGSLVSWMLPIGKDVSDE